MHGAAQKTHDGGAPEPPHATTFRARLARGTVIYAAANFIQRGLGLFLIPLYTHVLTPAEYGEISVVLAVSSFLSVFFLLALNGAVTRFYFDYEADGEKLRRFWGTILTFTLVVSACAGIALIAAGRPFLQGYLGNVAYHPLMALGIAAAISQPVFDIHLAVLQAREQALRYGVLQLASFLVKVGLVVALVAGLDLGAYGALFAHAAAGAAFLGIAIIALRREIAFVIDWRCLKEALAYSLPLVPHTVMAQLKLILERLLVNGIAGVAAAGIYTLAFQLGSVMLVFSASINRAYVPVFMSAMQSGARERLPQIARVGTLLTVIYCYLSALISIFAEEIVGLLTGKPFHEAARIVPFLAFTFAANGIYFLFVNVLFYRKDAVRYVALSTGIALAAGTLLNLLLIPPFGVVGAAIASLGAHIIFTVCTACIARRHAEIPWSYRSIALVFGAAFIYSLGVPSLVAGEGAAAAMPKLLASALLVPILSLLAWRRGAGWAFQAARAALRARSAP